MSLLLYNLVLRLYQITIGIASPFSVKAKDWSQGRQSQIINSVSSTKKIIWIHCASVGEFEQARPLIEKLSKTDKYYIILTFFSPSGYNLRKHYDKVNEVYYLPLDTKSNAKEFIEKISPELIIFVRYEFWYHYINEAFRKNIPLYVISATFRKNQVFFKWYGKLFKNLLPKVTHIFLQDSESEKLLNDYNIFNTTTSGDTRFERVIDVKNETFKDDKVEAFIQKNKKTIVFGSTWTQGEKYITKYINAFPTKFNYIIVPHEVDKKHIDELVYGFNTKPNLYSGSNPKSNDVLIIDKMGFLSYLYRYADIVYIGGGFGANVHNTLEPAVYNVPIIIGPNYKKFIEAIKLIELGAIRVVNDYKQFEESIDYFHVEENATNATKDVDNYFEMNKGALSIIINKINEEIK